MVVSGEPDKGTEDMLPGRKLVSGGSCLDRLKAHRRKHGLGKKTPVTPVEAWHSGDLSIL